MDVFNFFCPNLPLAPISIFLFFFIAEKIKEFVEDNVSYTKSSLFFLFIWATKPQCLSSSWVVWVVWWISNLLLWGDCSIEVARTVKNGGKQF